MPVSRPPKIPLQPFVALLWASDGRETAPGAAGRELVLPTGCLHIVVPLSGPPLRLFRDGGDSVGRRVAGPVIGGARAAPYLKAVAPPRPTVGALLRPGGAELMIGAPAGLFSHAHTPLEDVWGERPVAELRESLAAARTLSERLDLFEAALAARLPQVHGVNPLVAQALIRFEARWSVAAVVDELDCSHRHFAARFREAVGLKPKTFQRLLRFKRVLQRVHQNPASNWADLALWAGYADQAHFNREFLDFAGVTPGCYRRISPAFPNHVPLSA